MKRPNPLLFSLQRLVGDLSLIERNHHVLGSERAENDVEHSFAVALLCWAIIDQHQLDLDIGRVMKYAIVHDFPERYAGDINTYASKKERAAKVEREKLAIIRLRNEFKDFPDMVKSMDTYEAKADEEARFVWTVDKIQALILADMDDWRPYRKIGITFDEFMEKHHEQLQMSSIYCQEIFEKLLQYFETTFYDRPKTD